ncbi:MAG: DUF58 domain-containing protein [Citromicrobium sp.]|nr:DUF58 domain-containing protein [Citromicrobium sp.]
MAALLPTTRTARIVALAAPLALAVALIAPAAWLVVPVAAGGLFLLVLIDAARAGKLADWQLDHDNDVEIGQPAALRVSADLNGTAGAVRAALSLDPRMAPGGRVALDLRPDHGAWSGGTDLRATRRGTADIDALWIAWDGPWGLGGRQKRIALDRAIRIWPDLSPIRSQPLQALLRDAELGLINRRRRGEGTQFEALTEYQAGMDRRRIDWKASARHAALYARENEAERNNQIVFAFDCGQAMCEPIDGLPRLDRAVSAGLTAAYVALKGGDRTMLFGFARRPVLASPFVSDTRGFARLQQAAAGLDYMQGEEANYTLALATLSARLKRRSLVVLFSDFSDTTAAELMIESLARLTKRHAVVFVTLEDRELAGFTEAEPDSIDHLARAVTADALARQRQLVLTRLRRMGVDVIEAPHDRIGFALIDHYLALRAQEAIAG